VDLRAAPVEAALSLSNQTNVEFSWHGPSARQLPLEPPMRAFSIKTSGWAII
jgi:hypothetical protein